jgi:hypothetical protein
MEQKVTDSGKTRADHEAGKHDDRVFGAAQSYFTIHQCDVMAARMKLLAFFQSAQINPST